MTITSLAECPKHMEYGPCGGVELDGSCEVSPARCVFLDLPTVRWHGIERSVRSEEHTSELQSPSIISYAVFCL